MDKKGYQDKPIIGPVTKPGYRKGLRRRLPLVAVAMLGIVISSRSAWAVFPVSVVADPIAEADTTRIITNATDVGSTLQNQIKTTELDIIDALRNFSGQNTVNDHAIIQAEANIAGTQDARAVQMRITDTRMRGAEATAGGASVCNVITGAVAARDSFGAVSQWSEEIQAQQQDFFAGATTATPARNGIDAAYEARNANHCASNATAYDVATGFCPAGAVTQQPQTLATQVTMTPPVGRDLNASTILDPTNSTLSPADKVAADGFLINALDGHPVAAMPNGSATAANPAGRRQYSNDLIAIAQHSVAAEVGASIVADDTAMPGTGGTAGTTDNTQVPSGGAGTTSISQWAEGTAKQVMGYLPGGNNFPNGVSRAAFMKLRSMAWFWNPNWATQVGIQSSDQTLKDIAMIQAWSVYQNWVSEQQLRQMNLTLATMLTIMEARARGVSSD